MDTGIATVYGNKVRVRVCGLCWQEDNLLMVNHQGLADGDFWAPPGGGLAFGESAQRCLEREFVEETGLSVGKGRFLFACEFRREPLHAIELFFEVSQQGGTLMKGDDPELPIIHEVRFMSSDEIATIPAASLHGIFSLVPTARDLRTLTGFLTI